MAPKKMFSISLVLVCTLLMLSALVEGVYADNPDQSTTTTGQLLTIITDHIIGPITPSGFVTLTGRTAIGPLSPPTSLFYVVDVSPQVVGSSVQGQDCNGDGRFTIKDNFNRDASAGDTLDCEIGGIIALSKQLSASTVVSGGLIVFAGTAAVADVDPISNQQNFTKLQADNNANNIPDLVEVAEALTPESLHEFTASNVVSSTNFDNALLAITQAFATQATGQKIAFLLSSGEGTLNTDAGSPLALATQAGIIINTYAIGSAASGCTVADHLRLIADRTGGLCTTVAEASQLPAALTSTKPQGIDHVELRIDTGVPFTVTLDVLGNWSAPIKLCTAGPMETQATVVAKDGTRATADFTLCGPPDLPPGPEPTPPTRTSQIIYFPLISVDSE